MQFDEIAVIKENQGYLFENMRKVKNIVVIAKEESKEKIAENAVPGDPTCVFTCSSAPTAGKKEDKGPAGGKKGGKEGKGGKQQEAQKEPKADKAKKEAPSKADKGQKGAPA